MFSVFFPHLYLLRLFSVDNLQVAIEFKHTLHTLEFKHPIFEQVSFPFPFSFERNFLSVDKTCLAFHQRFAL